MGTEVSTGTVLAWIAAWAGPDLAALEALAAPEYVHHSGRDGTLATFKQGILMVNRTFEGYEVTVDQVVTDGAAVAVRWTGGGTFREPFFGIAATQQPAFMRGMTFFHVEDGKIQADWETLDMLGFRLRLPA